MADSREPTHIRSRLSKRSLAGVTPIAPMLSELVRAIPPGFWPAAGAGPLGAETTSLASAERDRFVPRPGNTSTSYDGPPGTYDLTEHARLIASRMDPGGALRTYTPASTPLMMAGVGDRTAHFLATLLE